jgi:integrase
MIFKKTKTLKYYAKDLFVPNGYWDRKRKQKGNGVIEKVLYKKFLIVRKHIIPIWGDMPIDKITVKIIDNELYKLNFAGSTKNEILACLKDIYKHLVEEEVIKENPVKNVACFSKIPLNRRGALTPDEIQKLFPQNRMGLLKIWGSEMYACAFLILKDTGLRPGELRALQWRDWNYKKRFFPIVKAIEAGTRAKIKGTKTGTNKPAIVSEFTAEYIEYFKICSKRINPDDFIFCLRTGRPPKNEIMSKHFQKGVRRAGLGRLKITPYWLRHTFNTRMLEIMPDEIARKLMGHTTSVMTRHYRDADVNSLLREAEKISEFLLKNKTENNHYQMELNFNQN